MVGQLLWLGKSSMHNLIAQTASEVCQVDPNKFWQLMFFLGRVGLVHFVLWNLTQWFYRM